MTPAYPPHPVRKTSEIRPNPLGIQAGDSGPQAHDAFILHQTVTDKGLTRIYMVAPVSE